MGVRKCTLRDLDREGEAAGRFRLRGLPMYLCVHRDGTLAGSFLGEAADMPSRFHLRLREIDP